MNDTSGNVYPILSYRDADAALKWLVDAFGFTEQAVHRDDDGAVVHAELRYGRGVVMFGQGGSEVKTDDTCRTYVAVPDADAHHDKAVAAGAEVTMPLTDQDYGSRDYMARDLEGNVWCFGTYGA